MIGIALIVLGLGSAVVVADLAVTNGDAGPVSLFGAATDLTAGDVALVSTVLAVAAVGLVALGAVLLWRRAHPGAGIDRRREAGRLATLELEVRVLRRQLEVLSREHATPQGPRSPAFR